MKRHAVTRRAPAADASLADRRAFLANLAVAAASATALGACGGGGDVQPAGNPERSASSGSNSDAMARRSYALDFATATEEDALSAGGRWSNNTQGVGGNDAPLNFTNLRVALASDGVTRIAMDNHGGINFDDSFAFVPGFGRNQYCEAVLYKESGYNPNASGSNHEVEIILGCSTRKGFRRWNEFLLNSGGGVDILSLDGGPRDFQSVGVETGKARVPVDGDVLLATKVGRVLRMYINGTLVCRYNGSLAAQGSGIGIAGFIRPGAVHNKFGFRRVAMGSW